MKHTFYINFLTTNIKTLEITAVNIQEYRTRTEDYDKALTEALQFAQAILRSTDEIMFFRITAM